MPECPIPLLGQDLLCKINTQGTFSPKKQHLQIQVPPGNMLQLQAVLSQVKTSEAGCLGSSVVCNLPLAQVVISGSWDRVPHWASYREPSSPLLMSLPLSVFHEYTKSLKKKKKCNTKTFKIKQNKNTKTKKYKFGENYGNPEIPTHLVGQECS